MTDIGGNITALIQVKTETGENRMGEKEYGWTDVHSILGFLDLMTGDSRYTNYNAKIQESTHIFICDYVPLNVNVSSARVSINGEIYDLKYIDDPMELHEHLELYLQKVG